MAIPIGIILFICPRLSEWIFQYDETHLRFLDTSTTVTKLNTDYFTFKLNQIETNYQENSADINKCLGKEKKAINNVGNNNNNNENQIIELQNFGNNNNNNKKEIDNDKSFEYLIAHRRCRAFTNFNKLVTSITSDINFDLFVNEKHDILPEDLAPLYSKRLLKQVENYEIRMYEIRAKLHTDQTKKDKEEKYELLKNREKLLKDFKYFIAEKDIDKQKLAIKCI